MGKLKISWLHEYSRIGGKFPEVGFYAQDALFGAIGNKKEEELMKAAIFLLALLMACPCSAMAGEVLFGGDVTLAKNITNERDYFSDNAKNRIGEADLFIWNCEFSGASRHKKTKPFVFSVDAEDRLKGMKFDNGVALIANNHSFDGNTEGFKNLVANLNSNEIQFVGLRNHVSENNFLKKEIDGRDYYILNFSPLCHNNDPQATVPTWNDILRSIDYINSVKKDNDVVIVNIHDGIERAFKPSGSQLGMAKTLAHKKVDIVSFTHSHTYIEPSKMGDTLVLWGMGNFIFGGNNNWRNNMDVRMLSVNPDDKTFKWVKGHTKNYKFDLN